MLKRIGFGALIVAMGIGVNILSSCKGDGFGLGPDGNKPSSYFNSFVQPIFTEKCTQCHFLNGPGYTPTGGAATGLDLSVGVAYSRLVGIPAFQKAGVSRVEPGSASTSYLIEKINDNPTAGGKMPLGGSLSAEEIKIITDWVNCGAPGTDGPPTCNPVEDTTIAITVPANFYADSIQPIFETHCVGCHDEFGPGDFGTGGPDSGLILNATLGYQRLVNYPSYGDSGATVRVLPGSPEQSSLYLKISSDTPPFGDAMPAGYALYNSDSLAVNAIYRWIAAGAPEN